MRQIVAILAVSASIAWLYAPVAVGLARQWYMDPDYSHGFLVVPLAAFFVWQRRAALAAADARPSAVGAVLILASLAVYLVGHVGAELFLMRVSLLGVVAGAVLFMAGPAPLRIAAFPIAFLLLMIPLPAILLNHITFPLQLVASSAGELVIATAGIPVLREGNLLHLPARTLEVAEACSGIRSLVSLVMLAVLVGHFGNGGAVMRVVLVLAAVPIAILANAARVAGTGVLSHWVGSSAADGFFHTFSGWVMFCVAGVGLLAVQWLAAPFDEERG